MRSSFVGMTFWTDNADTFLGCNQVTRLGHSQAMPLTPRDSLASVVVPDWSISQVTDAI